MCHNQPLNVLYVPCLASTHAPLAARSCGTGVSFCRSGNDSCLIAMVQSVHPTRASPSDGARVSREAASTHAPRSANSCGRGENRAPGQRRDSVASERRGNSLKRFNAFYLQAKARILDCICAIFARQPTTRFPGHRFDTKVYEP